MKKEQKYDVIIPTISRDFIRNRFNYYKICQYLPAKKLVFIGPEDIYELVNEYKNNNKYYYGDIAKVEYVNENDIVPYKQIQESLCGRIEREGYTIPKELNIGWYYQQFLKMSYSTICKDEYYISWDSDTIPLKKVKMFSEDNNPLFDIKREYNPAYFRTMLKLFNGMGKIIEGSFISEHMIFSVARMEEMIKKIEESDVFGKTYFDKIFSAISMDDIEIGFSEFETYGTFMMTLYPKEYQVREWNSMRGAGYCFIPEELTQEDIDWLSKDFDALTFERYNPYYPEMAELFHNKEYRKVASAGTIYQMLIDKDVFAQRELK